MSSSGGGGGPRLGRGILAVSGSFAAVGEFVRS